MVRASDNDDPPAGRPLLRVVRGDASPEEVAALVTVLLAAAGPAEQDAGRTARSAWSDPASRLRRPVFPAPGAWRRSALPG